jgi:predicted amidohydrolase YtcJ
MRRRFILGKEEEMGTIEFGTRANFAVFNVNPLTTEPRLQKDTAVSATIVDGRIFPISKAATHAYVASPTSIEHLPVPG